MPGKGHGSLSLQDTTLCQLAVLMKRAAQAWGLLMGPAEASQLGPGLKGWAASPLSQF